MSFFLSENLEELRNFLHGDSALNAGAPVALTIGNFDGVHLGHQALISRPVQWARKHSGVSFVLTFHPHPLEVLSQGQKHIRIFSLEDQHEQIEKLSVTGVFTQKFDMNFAMMTADEFMNHFVMKYFNPQYLAVGYDFSFGKDRSGTLDFLKQYCFKNKVEFEVVPALKYGEEIISSSLIRKKLEAGEVAKVKQYLGRPFYLKGKVVAGDHRGGKIGFPTANIQADWDFLPDKGVYVTQSIIDGEVFDSVTNVGTNPTFKDGQEIQIETHILDFNHDLYGKIMKVLFIDRIRAEMKFAQVADLISQIQNDVKTARGYFFENKNS